MNRLTEIHKAGCILTQDRGTERTRDLSSASPPRTLACISHHSTVEARDTTAMASLRLLAVLNVLFKYACA
ncbi:MAG: hypothetical protein OXL36_09670, partial [Bryobacterales bacterium]|nr:hypothetical protein [Bryobacterales bacterium]MDE0294724.1 hypothetical protein [Bryobacterales bacterium]